MKARSALVLATVFALVASPTAASAKKYHPHYTPGCDSGFVAYKMFGGTPSTHLADVHGTMTLCWNRRGHYAKGTHVNWTVTKTTWGTWYGMHFDETAKPFIASTIDEGHALMRNYESDWESKPCAYVLCGKTAAFMVGFSMEPPAAFGKPMWAWAEEPLCTNSFCRSHVSFQFNQGAH